MKLNLIKTKQLQNLAHSMSTCEPHAILDGTPTKFNQCKNKLDIRKGVQSKPHWVSEVKSVVFAAQSVKINDQLFVLGLYWLDVKPRAKKTPTSRRCLDTGFWLRMHIQHPGKIKINKQLYCTAMYLISSMLGFSGMETTESLKNVTNRKK